MAPARAGRQPRHILLARHLVTGLLAAGGRSHPSPGTAATRLPQAAPAIPDGVLVNGSSLLSVLVVMSAILDVTPGKLPRDADAAVRQLYSHHASALYGYVQRFCPDPASADDIVQETFIRAWRHLPQLSADDRPIGPWLYRVARNLLTDADRAARSRPVTVQAQPAEDARDDTRLDQVLDRQLVTDALQHLSPAHRTVLVETFYRGDSLAAVARQLGIPPGTARSRLHYALHSLRQQLQDHDAAA